MTGMEQLGEWLAEDRARDANIYAYGKRQWYCVLSIFGEHGLSKHRIVKDRYTPDAAAKAAVEAARKETR